EVLVVLQAGRDVDPGRRLLFVARQQRHDVVDAVLLVRKERYGIQDEPGEAALEGARLGDDRLVDREAAVAGARRLLVGGRRRKAIGQAAGALEHFALVVGSVLDLVFGRDGGGLGRRELRTAGLGEVAERHQRQAVAGRADLAIDPEAALQLRAIILAEYAGE